MIHAVAVLVLFAADPVTDPKIEAARKHIEAARTSHVASTKKQIAATTKKIATVKFLRKTVQQKLKIRKSLDAQLKTLNSTLKDVQSPGWIPPLVLSEAKVFGRLDVKGRSAMVEQVIDGTSFLLRLYAQEFSRRGKRFVPVERRTNVIIYVTGVPTKGFVDGRFAKFSGVFLVSTKTYRTVDGATKTVPLLTLVDDATLRKILAK